MSNTTNCEPNQHARSVCLFENSIRLVSLLDIVRQYMIWQLVLGLQNLTDQCDFCIRATPNGMYVSEELIDGSIKPLIQYLRGQFEAADLRAAIDRIDGPIRRALMTRITSDLLATEVRVLFEAMHSELCYRRFVFIPDLRARLHDRAGHEWALPWERIPECKYDAQEALDCYALGKNEACVFHSMRVAEYCLRSLARQLRVVLTFKGNIHPIEFADWDKVINGCNAKIAKARALNPGQNKAARLQLYSEAAQHCLYMKDIWRNDISHARKRYIEAEALSVLSRVREFALFLAANNLVGRARA